MSAVIVIVVIGDSSDSDIFARLPVWNAHHIMCIIYEIICVIQVPISMIRGSVFYYSLF